MICGVRSRGKAGAEMDAAAFAAWRAGVGLLDRTQRSQLLEDLALAEAADPIGHPVAKIVAGPMEAAATLAVAALGKTVDPAPGQGLMAQIGQARIARHGCPHCGGDDIRRRGKASGKPRYRCTNCGKSFNPLTGTPLAGLRHMDRWSVQAQALISGETVAKAADRCDVAYTTAFRWRHRFLAALNLDKPQHLSGIVEADETFILESFKGKRSDLPRPARKRGGKAAKRGLSVEQIPVMVARDRGGATIDAVLPRLDAASIAKALGGVITRPAELCCDGGSAITAFARRARLTFHVLPAPGIPKPEAPDLHINNVNAYHGRLKEWMRRFHGVATKNLPNYLSWRRTIEALGPAPTSAAWIKGAAGLGPYYQSTL
jgi:transposase-like protein